MGFFDDLFDVGKDVLQAVGFVTNPVGSVAASIASGAISNQIAPEREPMNYSPTLYEPSGSQYLQPTATPPTTAGFGFLGPLLQGARTVAQTAGELDVVARMFGGRVLPDSAQTAGQQTAVDVQSRGGQESAGSGVMQAGVGGLVVPFAQQAGRLIGGRVGAVSGLGGLAGGLLTGGMMGGRPSGKRITRKMKAEIRKMYILSGGNAQLTAQVYSNLTGLNLNAQDVFAILLKRFRNDGPYVTKAAVRKTRQTVRKLKHLETLKKEITGSTTRRAPARRRSTTTTLIKN
jgi:hypothetical protein